VSKDPRLVQVSLDIFDKVKGSYSGDTIAESKTVRKPFKFEGVFYVSTGGYSGRYSLPSEEAYQMVPRDQFQGQAKWYGQKLRDAAADHLVDWGEQRRNQPEGFYHGMLIKRGEMEWVLVGPPVIFQPREGEARTKQLALNI